MKKVCVLFAIVVAMVAVTIVVNLVIVSVPPEPGLAVENYDQIEDGMSIDDDAALYGRKPDFYSDPDRFGKSTHTWKLPSGNRTTVWIGQEGVFRKEWPHGEETLNYKVRRWLAPAQRQFKQASTK